MDQSNNTLRDTVVESVALKFADKFLSFGIQIVISIILARVLLPKDYGIIAIINVLIVLSNVLVEGGFAVGLVQKKQLSSNDINTLFTCSLTISTMIYFVIYLASPYVIRFYNLECSAMILQVYGLYVIISAICSIYNSMLSRNFEYKVQLYASLSAVIISGFVGIYCAYKNMGPWALVVQQLLSRFIYSGIIICYVKYVPRFFFCKSSFFTVFNFGYKIILSRLISAFFNEIYNLIIGKMFTTDVLGFYERGRQIPASFATATDYSLQNVMFSAYSKTQDDILTLKRMVRRTMTMSSYILFPMMIGLASIAHPLVVFVLTDKWLNCVPFFQIACFAFLFQPINAANIQAINALGKSEITLKIEVKKRIVATILIVISLFFNVYVIASTLLFSTMCGCYLTIKCNQTILNYSLKEQVKDLASNFIIAMIMGGVVYSVSYIPLPVFLKLVLQVFLGCSVYFLLSFITKNDSFFYIFNYIKAFIDKQKNNTKPINT